jgi:hypothetical protein
MDAKPSANGDKCFTVVMRRPAAIVFWENESLRISSVPTAVGPVDVTYATRWIDRGEKVRIPGQLWVEVIGPGDTLDNVLVPYANAGIVALPLLSLASNVSIEEPDIDIGFESTPDISRRDYFQNYLPSESSVLRVGRHVNLDTVFSRTSSRLEQSRFGAPSTGCKSGSVGP